MSEYVTIDDVKELGSMPPEDIDELEALYPGIVSRTSRAISGMFDARLRKRYAVPFEAPYPEAIIMPCAAWVAWRLWLKRGFNPSATHAASIERDYEDAREWLREAADSQDGLVELPRREEPLGPGAVNQGGPLGYSEASPYTWTDRQIDEVRGG